MSIDEEKKDEICLLYFMAVSYYLFFTDVNQDLNGLIRNIDLMRKREFSFVGGVVSRWLRTLPVQLKCGSLDFSDEIIDASDPDAQTDFELYVDNLGKLFDTYREDLYELESCYSMKLTMPFNTEIPSSNFSAEELKCVLSTCMSKLPDNESDAAAFILERAQKLGGHKLCVNIYICALAIPC